MARVNYIITNFTSGEISPKLRGRVDISKYNNGLRRLFNFIAVPYGGARKRPGTQFISELETQSETARLVKFEFSQSQSYILEFTDNQIRFLRDKALILQGRDFDNGDFTSNIDGWTDNSNGTGSISHATDKLELNGGGSGNEAIATQAINYLGISEYTVSVDVGTNGIDWKVGTTDGGSEIDSGSLSTGSQTFTFQDTGNNDTLYITFEYGGSATATIDNVSLDSPAYKIYSPYPLSVIDELDIIQTEDLLYIFHEDYPTRKLIRRGNDQWQMTQVEFIDGPYQDINSDETTITPSGTTGSITLTASDDVFVSTDVGRLVRYKAGPSEDDSTSYTGNGTQTNFDIPFYPQGADDIEVFLVASSGDRTLEANPGDYTVSDGQVVMGLAPTSSERVIIQPKDAGSGRWGYCEITSYTSATEVDADVKVELQGTNASTLWRLGAWSETTGYPSKGVFHQQRLFTASSSSEPQRIWGSTSGIFEDFSPDGVLNDGSITDSSAINVRIVGDNDQTVLWMVSQRSLLAGTYNKIHSITGGTTDTAITPNNISTRAQLKKGCADREPLEVEEDTIFIENLRKRLQSIRYDFGRDGFAPQDLTLLSEHLPAKSPLDKIVYQDVPDRTIWAIRDDGVLLSCAYFPDQEVIGWSEQGIAGTDVVVEDFATIPGDSSNELYLLVKRTINGSTKRYIEVLTESFDQDLKEDAFFVDSGLQYDGSATDTLSGLDHLEGETLQVLADGSAHPDVEVSSGSITLDYEVEKATVGLKYESLLETNTIEAGSSLGTSQGSVSRIHEVVVRLLETLGGSIGYQEDKLDTIYFRKASTKMNQSPDLFTGDKILKFPSGQHDNYKIYFKHDEPFPCHILAFVAKAYISDR